MTASPHAPDAVSIKFGVTGKDGVIARSFPVPDTISDHPIRTRRASIRCWVLIDHTGGQTPRLGYRRWLAELWRSDVVKTRKYLSLVFCSNGVENSV